MKPIKYVSVQTAQDMEMALRAQLIQNELDFWKKSYYWLSGRVQEVFDGVKDGHAVKLSMNRGSVVILPEEKSCSSSS